METILWGSIAGGLAGIVSSLILARLHILPRTRAAESAEPQSGAPLQTPSDPAPPAEQAQTASEHALRSDSCTPMFAMIDMDHMLMLHATSAIPRVEPAGISAGTR